MSTTIDANDAQQSMNDRLGSLTLSFCEIAENGDTFPCTLGVLGIVSLALITSGVSLLFVLFLSKRVRYYFFSCSFFLPVTLPIFSTHRNTIMIS